MKETTTVPVLNAGFVELIDHMGDDDSIIRAARVSYAGDSRTGEDPQADMKLLKYLLKNRHTSPFEAVTFTFHVKAPIFVLRQWHRHRTWSYNEVSARYTELDEGFYLPGEEQITTQSTDNKQMRTAQRHPAAAALRLRMQLAMNQATDQYRSLLEDGCPRELARSVLPVATYSRMFATVDLHNLLHFLTLRLHEHAQYEIRVYAQAMFELISGVVPRTVACWQALRG